MIQFIIVFLLLLSFVCFSFSSWIPADSVSVQFLLFLALLQFHTKTFETERLYMSSEVSQKKKGWVTPPKIIVASSNMCL